MVQAQSNQLNMLWITGSVVGITQYEDTGKLVLTLRNTDGNFCVEGSSTTTYTAIAKGDQVVVQGSLFSLRAGRYDRTKIRAYSIRRVI
jgi:hypothetical protein